MKKPRLLPNSIRSKQRLVAGRLTPPAFGYCLGEQASTIPRRRLSHHGSNRYLSVSQLS
jgi:hypothetical protein